MKTLATRVDCVNAISDRQPRRELLAIMPAYNEEASVRKVIIEWIQELENWTEQFIFLVIDDGSSDRTAEIVLSLAERFPNRLLLYSRRNHGHGQTCLEGYRIACDAGVPNVFQIDSDGQCDPQYFFKFWRLRDKFDVVYGKRVRRDDGFKRVVSSIILRMCLLLFARADCRDANVPYRLMRTASLSRYLELVPAHFHLANVALAVLLKRGGVPEAFVPIRFRERFGGEPSVAVGQFATKALELIRQLGTLKTMKPCSMNRPTCK